VTTAAEPKVERILKSSGGEGEITIWPRPSISRARIAGPPTKVELQSVLRTHEIPATVRREKCHDIKAVCGQLGLQTKRGRDDLAPRRRLRAGGRVVPNFGDTTERVPPGSNCPSAAEGGTRRGYFFTVTVVALVEAFPLASLVCTVMV
jgi:hypothetical protein